MTTSGDGRRWPGRPARSGGGGPAPAAPGPGSCAPGRTAAQRSLKSQPSSWPPCQRSLGQRRSPARPAAPRPMSCCCCMASSFSRPSRSPACVQIVGRHLARAGPRRHLDAHRGHLRRQVMAGRVGHRGERRDRAGPVAGPQPGPGQPERRADVGRVHRPHQLEVAASGGGVPGGLGGEGQGELGGQLAGQRVADGIERGPGAARAAPRPGRAGRCTRRSASRPGRSRPGRPARSRRPDRSPVTMRDRASASRVSADSATAGGVPCSPATAAASACGPLRRVQRAQRGDVAGRRVGGCPPAGPAAPRRSRPAARAGCRGPVSAVGRAPSATPMARSSGLNSAENAGLGLPSATASTSRSTPVSCSAISPAEPNRRSGSGSVARRSARQERLVLGEQRHGRPDPAGCARTCPGSRRTRRSSRPGRGRPCTGRRTAKAPAVAISGAW